MVVDPHEPPYKQVLVGVGQVLVGVGQVLGHPVVVGPLVTLQAYKGGMHLPCGYPSIWASPCLPLSIVGISIVSHPPLSFVIQGCPLALSSPPPMH